MKESVLWVGSSIPPLQSSGGTFVSDSASKAALLTGSSLWMLLTAMFPVLPLGPERFVGCFRSLILTVKLIR